MPLPETIHRNEPQPRTEAELRERLIEVMASEQRLRQVVNADPFALLIGDLSGGIRYMNPPLREMLGYTYDEVASGRLTWKKLTPPEFSVRDDRAMYELRRYRRCRLYEKEYIARDGRRVPILIGASMIVGEDGHDEVAAFITDLSELVQTQHKLQSSLHHMNVSDERSRQLIRANPFGILIGRPHGTIDYVNPTLLKLLGYTPDDVAAGRLLWDEITPSKYAELDRSSVERVYLEGTSPAYEKEYRTCDGRLLPVLVGLTLIPNLEGGNDIAAFITDLTELKNTERELHESRQQIERQFAEMETLYRIAPVGLAFFDPKEFRYLRLNDQQAEIIGRPKSEILGRTLTEMAPIPGLHEMFERVATGKPVVNELLEGELPSRPGEQRSWRVNYFPAYSQEGTLEGISAASLEVTHQRQAEEALRQTEKLAAVGRLAASISHEINNPLEAITNLLYLARVDPNEKQRREYLETAEHELGRVSQIATQTLRFHRQSGRPTSLTVAELVDPVLALYAGRLANSGITIQRSYRSKTNFLCMEGDMRQVLNNLIGNAIDAMRSGGT